MHAIGPTPLTRDAPVTLSGPAGPIPSFVDAGESNLDAATVAAFGAEWERFQDFSDDDVESGGREYFAELLPDSVLVGARVLDLGCGSGRWSRYFARRAGFVEAVDPSAAVYSAARATAGRENIRVIQAGVSSLPFAPGTFDIVASVGVLHHLPNTRAAVTTLGSMLRAGGLLYLYLYYNLEGRPASYRAAFWLSSRIRAVVCRLPAALKHVVCDVLAVVVYLPLIALARVIRTVFPSRPWFQRVPLHYYVDKPWKVVRNDALDRFGTPIERRFSRAEIAEMIDAAGLTGVRFADDMPRWRVVARRST